jgi:hypothetical protein
MIRPDALCTNLLLHILPATTSQHRKTAARQSRCSRELANDIAPRKVLADMEVARPTRRVCAPELVRALPHHLREVQGVLRCRLRRVVFACLE